jgi:hypothetical protein
MPATPDSVCVGGGGGITTLSQLGFIKDKMCLLL